MSTHASAQPPVVRVLPGDNIRSWYGAIEDGDPLGKDDRPVIIWGGIDLFDAMFQKYDTDAHIQTCTPRQSVRREDDYPRISKQAIRTHHEMDWVMPVVLVDLDRTNHSPWESKQQREDMQGQIVEDLRTSGSLGFDMIYMTRAGCRLVAVLKEPHPVAFWGRYARFLSESVVPWVAGVPCLAGLDVDMKVKDPTRLIRLPFVVRRNGAGEVMLTPDDIPDPAFLLPWIKTPEGWRLL